MNWNCSRRKTYGLTKSSKLSKLFLIERNIGCIVGDKQRQILLLQSVNQGVETPHSLAAYGSLFNVYQKLARCILRSGRCLRRTRFFKHISTL